MRWLDICRRQIRKVSIVILNNQYISKPRYNFKIILGTNKTFKECFGQSFLLQNIKIFICIVRFIPYKQNPRLWMKSWLTFQGKSYFHAINKINFHLIYYNPVSNSLCNSHKYTITCIKHIGTITGYRMLLVFL